jgi:hypothetical protein
MDGVRYELTSVSQEFDRVHLDRAEGTLDSIDIKELRSLTDSSDRRLSQNSSDMPTDAFRNVLVFDVDIETSNSPSRGNTNTTPGPPGPNLDLVLGGPSLIMSFPISVSVPCAFAVFSRIFCVWADRQNG